MDEFYRFCLYFAIYSVSGWAIETAFCSLLVRRFENRGFLNGPVCPVYAAGALAIVLLMSRIPRTHPAVDIAAVFILGMVTTSLIEYFTGWLLEVLFKAKWWDYSDSKFNIKGRVCLPNSLAFGALCVALIFVIHPAVYSLVGRLPGRARAWLAAAFLAVLLADLLVTVFTVLELNKRLKKIQANMLAIKEKLDSIQWETAAGIRDRITRAYESLGPENPLVATVRGLHERVRHIENENRRLQNRVLHAFPNLKSVKYPEYLTGIREHLDSLRKRRA